MAKKDLDDISQDNMKEDIEKDDIVEFGSPAVDPRAEAMAKMVQNSADERELSRQELIADQGFDPNPLDEEEDEDVEIIDEEAIKDEKIVDNEVIEDDTNIIEREGKKYFRLEVNGEVKEMPLDAARILLQKNENVDQKLWEADQSKKKYDELVAQHTEETTREDVSSESAVDTHTVLKDAVTKVYDGDVDEAVELLEKVMTPTQTSEPVDVKAEVASAVAAHDDYKAVQSAYHAFMEDEDFKAITSDPVLLDRVNTFTEDLQQDPEFLKSNPSYTDFFAEAGKRTKDWIEKISGHPLKAADENSEETVDSRLERKRSTPSKPTARTVRRGAPKDEKPFAKSTHDIIAAMAQRRGQTQL